MTNIKVERIETNNKREKVKEFIKEVYKIDLEKRNCVECPLYHERLYDISHKIVNQYVVSEQEKDPDFKKGEKKLEKFQNSLSIIVGRLIDYPPYLYECFGKWNPDNGEMSPGKDNGFVKFLVDLIRNYSSSMTPHERKGFDNAFSYFEMFFLCPSCGYYCLHQIHVTRS